MKAEQDWESAILALEIFDQELEALDTTKLAPFGDLLNSRGEALAKVIRVLDAAPNPFPDVKDQERLRRILQSGDRLMQKLRQLRAEASGEWSRLNQEKYLLCSMLNTALPTTSRIDFTG